jgi:hypothetical protein
MSTTRHASHRQRGRDTPVEELKVIDVARALPRFRAFPDDTGIALQRDKRALAGAGRVRRGQFDPDRALFDLAGCGKRIAIDSYGR